MFTTMMMNKIYAEMWERARAILSDYDELIKIKYNKTRQNYGTH